MPVGIVFAPRRIGKGGIMAVAYVALLAAVFLFGASAVYGLVWALRTGQMDDFRAGAASIFDEDEPAERPTDGFPDEERPS
jgi:nitrogen fixation-related uncharacterized protein